MRELTAATIAALHALHLMLRRQKPMSIREIQQSGGFDSELIRAVVGKLRNAGLVGSRSGHGYVLAKAPGEISIRDVVDVVDLPSAPTAPCGGNFAACQTRAACILAPLCRNAEAGYQETLRSFTLAELMDVPMDVPNCLDSRLNAEVS